MEKGTLYFFTGLSGAGKTTLGGLFYQHLREKKPNVVLFDGDILRAVSYQDLGYSTEARRASSFHMFELIRLLTEQGIDIVCCSICMYKDVRTWNREHIPNYKEIYVRVKMDTLYRRDQKGLYTGDIPEVVGKDLPWDEPETPDLIIQNDGACAPSELVTQIEAALSRPNAAGTLVLGLED